MASESRSGSRNLNRPLVAVVGTCDTKLDALVFLKRTIISTGTCDAILIDVGTHQPSETKDIDISGQHVLAQAKSSPTGGSRNEFSKVMAQGLALTLTQLSGDITTGQRSIAGVIAAGGSGNTSISTHAFREALPIGFPKLVVSTMASGDVSHYVGETDITLMHSVVDVAGLNDILEGVLRNAAYGIAGMASHYSPGITPSSRSALGTVAVTMFGVTTPCVEVATKALEKLGYTAVVFHATGTGGLAMERLIAEGKFVGVLDLTTTELADDLVGGVLSAGPHRLEAAAKAGIPQVVSVGALDMINFGPKSTVPKHFESGRIFHEHNPSVTLMRTTRNECAELGRTLAKKVNIAPKSTRVFLPLRGVSLIDVQGGPFHDHDADGALFDELRSHARCQISELDLAINDPAFANATVDALHELLCAQEAR